MSYKYVFLPNEPTDFEMKNMGYPARREEVMEEKSPEKRWVRFGKRTHREGYFAIRRGRFGPLLGRFGSEFRWALGIGRGMAGYLNLNGWLAASHL